MRLSKLATIFCACTLFAVACATANNTNQTATTNANAPTATTTATTTATPADQLAEARKMFAEGGVCARCHGTSGEGGEFDVDGKKLKAPSLRTGHAVKHDDAALKKKIEEGGDGMPAFKKRLTSEQIDNLVRFIRQDLQAGAAATGATNVNHAAANSH
jgi:mono/diheme cytochrome c family protein